MNRELRIPILIICLLLAISCGTRKPNEKAVATTSNDTLTMSDVRRLVPDSTDDSTRLTRALLRVVLSGCGKTMRNQMAGDTVAQKLSQRLSMISGKEWSAEASGVLMAAGRSLSKVAQETGNSDALFGYAESLCVTNSSVKNFKLPGGSVFTVNPDEKESLAELFQRIFSLGSDEAGLVAEFVWSEQHLLSTGENALNMVKGLFSALPGYRGHFSLPRPVFDHDNSELALRFRSLQSISDTIGKHILDLQAIYKRLLKRHSDMSGNVWVVFRVDPSGKVIELNIKSSQIPERDFLNRLSEYAKTIRFQEIPENVGFMTFEFPFEFKSEM